MKASRSGERISRQKNQIPHQSKEIATTSYYHSLYLLSIFLSLVLKLSYISFLGVLSAKQIFYFIFLILNSFQIPSINSSPPLVSNLQLLFYFPSSSFSFYLSLLLSFSPHFFLFFSYSSLSSSRFVELQNFFYFFFLV